MPKIIAIRFEAKFINERCSFQEKTSGNVLLKKTQIKRSVGLRQTTKMRLSKFQVMCTHAHIHMVLCSFHSTCLQSLCVYFPLLSLSKGRNFKSQHPYVERPPRKLKLLILHKTLPVRVNSCRYTTTSGRGGRFLMLFILIHVYLPAVCGKSRQKVK